MELMTPDPNEDAVVLEALPPDIREEADVQWVSWISLFRMNQKHSYIWKWNIGSIGILEWNIWNVSDILNINIL